MATITYKRVRFIACEGDDKRLIGRTGFIFFGGKRLYTQAGFDSLVLLDAHPDDEELRQYFGGHSFRPTPELKWRERLAVEADSAEHLEVIGTEEVEL